MVQDPKLKIMNLQSIIKHFISSARQEGLGQAAANLVRRAKARVKERALGISTSALYFPDQLGYSNPECHEYSATEYDDFNRMMETLAIKPAEHAFLDYGAGLGRVVVVAATYPFKNVRGVELSAELTDAANQNIAAALPKLLCKDVSVVCADATKYDPEDETSVIYMNNPFEGEILDQVLDKLRRFASGGNRLLLMCNMPARSAFAHQVQQQPWLTVRNELELAPGRLCLILQSEAPKP